jgi:hypothetical protein
VETDARKGRARRRERVGWRLPCVEQVVTYFDGVQNDRLHQLRVAILLLGIPPPVVRRQKRCQQQRTPFIPASRSNRGRREPYASVCNMLVSDGQSAAQTCSLAGRYRRTAASHAYTKSPAPLWLYFPPSAQRIKPTQSADRTRETAVRPRTSSGFSSCKAGRPAPAGCAGSLSAAHIMVSLRRARLPLATATYQCF